jgi:hypothetical protein
MIAIPMNPILRDIIREYGSYAQMDAFSAGFASHWMADLPYNHRVETQWAAWDRGAEAGLRYERVLNSLGVAALTADRIGVIRRARA